MATLGIGRKVELELSWLSRLILPLRCHTTTRNWHCCRCRPAEADYEGGDPCHCGPASNDCSGTFHPRPGCSVAAPERCKVDCAGAQVHVCTTTTSRRMRSLLHGAARTTSATSQFRKLMSAGSGPDRRLLFRAVCMPQIYGPYMHCVPVPVLSLAQHKGLLEDRAEASCLISTCMGGT